MLTLPLLWPGQDHNTLHEVLPEELLGPHLHDQQAAGGYGQILGKALDNIVAWLRDFALTPRIRNHALL
jgi:hypothetical protein